MRSLGASTVSDREAPTASNAIDAAAKAAHLALGDVGGIIGLPCADWLRVKVLDLADRDRQRVTQIDIYRGLFVAAAICSADRRRIAVVRDLDGGLLLPDAIAAGAKLRCSRYDDDPPALVLFWD